MIFFSNQRRRIKEEEKEWLFRGIEILEISIPRNGNVMMKKRKELKSRFEFDFFFLSTSYYDL